MKLRPGIWVFINMDQLADMSSDILDHLTYFL